MKVKKLMFLMVLILSLVLSGCNYEAAVADVLHDLASQLTEPETVMEAPSTRPTEPETVVEAPSTQPTEPEEVEPFIGFASAEVEETDELLQLKPEELRYYVSEYNKYNNYIYFQHLNETEKLLYRAYEYALDKALPYIVVDDRLLPGMSRPAFQVLEFLSLDSAVVEQNISCSHGEFTVTHTVQDVPTASETYATFFVDNFSEEKLKNKKRAIMEARVIVARESYQKGRSNRELAEKFFEYMGLTEYVAEVESEEYLYSALCQTHTNCDGYTNAFALLCAIAEIPCIEINSDTPVGEVGHTWNMVFLEGKWVHVDGTGAEAFADSDSDTRNEDWVYFGFPDSLLQEKPLYRNIIPACPEGLNPILHIPSGRIENFNYQVRRAFEENDRMMAIILVDEGDLKAQMNADLATELDCDLNFVYYETFEGKMVYHLFNDDD